MAKIIRSMQPVTRAQEKIESKVIDKFSAIQEEIKATRIEVKPKAGRISPQLSCTIAPEDKDMLDKLALYACNKHGKLLNMSKILRAIIRLGDRYKTELEF